MNLGTRTNKLLKSVKEKSTQASQSLIEKTSTSLQTHLIGPMEKGMQAAKMNTPPHHVLHGVDLHMLPKYICYKAALMREKLALQSALWLCGGAFLLLFTLSRCEVSHLYDKLRQKEYILAPGVQDFIPASPQNVPESHVQNAVMEFLQTFGNINPTNIDEQYKRLAENMSSELKVRFELEALPWKNKVKSENISETLAITDREILADAGGYYKVTAFARKYSYVNYEHIGSRDVVIEMILKLVSPNSKKWYLEIQRLESKDANTFHVKSGFEKHVTTNGNGGGNGK